MVKTKLTVLALSALAIGGIGMGLAYTASATPPTPAVSHSVTSVTEAPDAGGLDVGPNVLQGSQTGPDAATGVEKTTAEAPDAGGVDVGPNVQQGLQSGPDTPGIG